MSLNSKIKQAFLSGALAGKTIKQIFAVLDAKKGFEKDAVRGAIETLEKENVVFCDGGRYILFESAGLVKGTIRGHERGYAFLVPENEDYRDFFIPPHALGGAFHGDLVYVKPKDISCGDNDEAEVVKIVARNDKIVGTYQAERTYGFVVPDEDGFTSDIFVPFKSSLGAVTGDKVLCRITAYPFDKNPEGEIIEILGKKYDLGAEERSIIAAHKIPVDFPKEVTAFLAEYNRFSAADAAGRVDFRDQTIITIDGEDARDLDDAISLKTLEHGHFLLGVHIADGSFFVTEGSPVDREAMRRGTSVYFPDNVIPMLPRELSNGICSLSEGVDRFTLSCVMEVDERGEVVDKTVAEGVIRSAHRMTYTAVDGLLSGDEKLKNEYADILPLIENMRALAEILIKKRERRGSVDLDVKEAEIRVDARGEISISPLFRTLSHRIIEDFMVLANETIAEYARYTEIPFLFRVHETPKEGKLEDFKTYLKNLGVSVRWSAHGVHPSDFSSLLKRLEGSPYFPLVNKVMLRSMNKAVYSPENVGHFGLASECYCHFTSPIRRYPDLVVHRAIKRLIFGGIGQWFDEHVSDINEIAKGASACERRADEAERDVDDLFKARFMRNFIGEEFEGIVSGVTAFGVFVELPNTVEGLIKIETLPAGSYDFDKKSYSLSSKRLTFHLGERVKIRVAGVNQARRKVEFIYVNKC